MTEAKKFWCLDGPPTNNDTGNWENINIKVCWRLFTTASYSASEYTAIFTLFYTPISFASRTEVIPPFSSDKETSFQMTNISWLFGLGYVSKQELVTQLLLTGRRLLW